MSAEPAPDFVHGPADALVREISSLIRAGSDLDRIERTLTDGYAYALSLEGEQLRLERRIGEVARTIDEGARELPALTRRLDGATSELAQLRALLDDLRQRAHELRAGAFGIGLRDGR